MNELQAIKSARGQYQAMFRSMARGGVWNIHRGSTGNPVLLIEDAQIDGELPIIVRNVQTMGEQTMANALSVALRNLAN